MVVLTPEMAENTLMVMGVSYVLVILYSLYMAYLGHKQAKVNKKMDEVISELKKISKILERRR